MCEIFFNNSVRWVLAWLVLIAPMGCGSSDRGQPQVASRPATFVWAWRRAEDLRFLDPADTGAAVWIATVRLAGDRIRVEAREWPILLPTGIHTEAVVRIESALDDPMTGSIEPAERIAEAIDQVARGSGFRDLQIDFDARLSERQLYRELLEALRARRGDRRLSMTGLVSWCSEDWLDSLPVDEVVPMLFRLGPQSPEVRRSLERGGFRSERCGTALGVSNDEPIPRLGKPTTLYLFHDVPWTGADFAADLERARRALQ